MKLKSFILSILSTIRAGNLFIICISLFLVRYTLVKPILELSVTPSSLSDQAFIFLVLSVLLIAAGGYIINDYFDTGIDAINKPGKNKIGATINRSSALTSYIIITLTGLFFSFMFGELAGIRYPLLGILICAGLLYFYASSYKKMFLIGNIIISLLTAVAVFISILFDKQAMLTTPIVILTAAYSIFAFLMTLAREIIKDCEDVEGDQVFGSFTLPVVWGLKTARFMAAFITLITFAGLLWVQVSQKQWENKVSFVYVSAFIQVPLLYLFYRILKSRSKQNDHFNSNLSKLIMVTGILSMIVFYFSSN